MCYVMGRLQQVFNRILTNAMAITLMARLKCRQVCASRRGSGSGVGAAPSTPCGGKQWCGVAALPGSAAQRVVPVRRGA